MAKRKKEQEHDERLRLQNFHKRWNIELSEEERWVSFHNHVLNAYAESVGYEILRNSKCEEEFFKLIGLHALKSKSKYAIDIFIDQELSKSPVYVFFLKESDIKKFILCIEVIFWMTTLEWSSKYEFLENIKNAIVITGVPIMIKETDDEILFYPSGAKLLDQSLVNDNLDWLIAYPTSYSPFKAALLEIGSKGKERHVIDNLRLSLELLLKSLFKNNKSLENQKSEIGKYLKNKETSQEISNLFWLVLDYYSKYQNDKIKHSDNAKSDEVEFLLYITGTLIRFLLTK